MVVPVYYVDGATFVVHTIDAKRFAHVTCPDDPRHSSTSPQ
jgi:hypothetical protein